MGKTEDRQRLTLSFTPEEREALEEQAAKEMRTISGLAKVYIIKGLAEAGKKVSR